MDLISTDSCITRIGVFNPSRLDTLVDDFGVSVYAHISNYTRNPIQVVDRHGQSYVITPEQYCSSESLKGLVVVTEWTRCQEFTHLGQMKTVRKIATYSEHEFRHSAMYDPVSNMMLAVATAKDVKHPYTRNISQEYMDHIHEEILGQFTQPPYTIVCNDATGQLDHLYCIINNNLCVIGVTNHTEEDTRCEILVARPSDSKVYSKEVLDLEQIKAGEVKFELSDNKLIFIGVNSQKVLNSCQAYLRSTHMSKDTQDLKKYYEMELSEQEDSYKSEIKKRDLIIKELKEDHSDEVKDLKRELERKDAVIHRYHDKEEWKYKYEQAEHDRRMKEDQKHISDMKRKEVGLKILYSIIGAAIPLIVMWFKANKAK
jgi:hypothetical protein